MEGEKRNKRSKNIGPTGKKPVGVGGKASWVALCNGFAPLKKGMWGVEDDGE